MFLPFILSLRSAFKLNSPIHVVRPLIDIHTTCEQDIKQFCNPLKENIQKNNMQHSNESITTNKMMENDNDREEGNGTQIARRLNELEYKTVTKKVSISIGLRKMPKNSKETSVRVKNNKRFLDYGPSVDTCLWNAFAASQVSRQCASALAYLNDMPDSSPFGYDNGSKIWKKKTTVSLSFSCFQLVMFILCCVLIGAIYNKEDDNTGDEMRDENKAELVHDEYQSLDDSKKISVETAVVAVPLEAI